MLSKSNMSIELWPRQGLWMWLHYDFDFRIMTICGGHDTPLGGGEQLCEILSKS